MTNYKELMNDIEPKTSDDAFMSSVFGRNTKKTHKKLRNTCIFAVIMVALTGTTLTAGAVNDWDYIALARNLFGGKQALIEGMHEEISYTVSGDAAQGISYRVSGLFAERDLIIVSIDIISKKPIFDVNLDYGKYTARWDGEFLLFNHKMNRYEQILFAAAETIVTDEQTITVVYHFENLINEVLAGNEYTLNYAGIDITEVVLSQGITFFDAPETGNVNITFTIDEVTAKSEIIIYPDILLESVYTITEIHINLFGINIFLEGEGEYIQSFGEYYTRDEYFSCSLIFRDGTVIIPMANFATYGGGDFGAPDNHASVEVEFRTFFGAGVKTLSIEDIMKVVYLGVEIPVS